MRSARKPLTGIRRLPLAFWPAIFVLLLASILSVGLGLPPTPNASHAQDAIQSAVVGIQHKPIPFFPVHVRPIGVTVPAVINPLSGYSSEPAPMGIGDFGVGAGGNPYTYNTTEFLGNFSWQSLNMNNGGDTSFSDQLNVVLEFAQGGSTYAYWIQDVAFMDSATGDLGFENNIWNFSSGSYCLSNSALSGNGTVYPISGCEGYYAVGASSQPGANEVMPSPGDFSLLVRSYFSGGGLPEVAFEYWDGVTSYEVTYDNVVWPWAHSVTFDHGFYVDGNATAPSGNFYDAELSIGGPGGGSATIAQSVTNIGSRLFLWNGHNLEAPRSVWNFGADTAEAISNVQSFFTHDPDGTPHTTQLNGTARNATPGKAYDQGRVGILAVSAPTISSGTVWVNGTTWNFQADQLALTLAPGIYPVWVNSTSQHNDLGNCRIIAGQTKSITLPGGCGLSVGTPMGTPSGVDVGQTVVFQATLLDPGSGGDTYNWGSLAAGLNCAPSTTNSISCQPTTQGTYAVSVTVTDSDSQTNTSGTLEFTVDSDPVVGTPNANPTTVETGAPVTFTASPSGGSGGYSYSWTHLPTPCTAASSAAPTCHPSTAGTYAVSVSVTDSNGYEVTSSTLDYTVAAGPSVSIPTATPAGPIDLGGQANFSATASGGVGPYSYSWQNLPTGCTSANLPILECRPTASGTASVTVSVTDSLGGHIISGILSFTINAAVKIGSVTSTPAAIDLGRNVTLSATGITGGSGIYDYSWSDLPSGCATANNPSIVCAPSKTGTFAPNVTARDTLGGNATAGTTFIAVPDPSVGGIGVSRAGADLGQTVNYSGQGLTGGIGGYRYAWTGLPTGCSSANSSKLVCTPTDIGRFSVTLSVTDADHVSGSLTIQYIVYALPVAAPPTISSGTPFVGQTFDLTTSVNEGSGNFSYAWTGLPPGCSSANSSTIACTPTLNGTFGIVVTVRDSNGGSATSAALSLTVEPRVVPPASAEPPYLLIAGLVVLAAAVATAVVLVRRRKRATPPPLG
ncbi:MAG TPA: thermopsin family protease [Thermoplasmata archaeon]|nr:thermopsin family protease [Thermoplasmata archaeon]